MEQVTKSNIGQRINSTLAQKNIKQKELAKALDVSDNIVSYYCSGSRTPNTEQIIKIAKYCNVSADYLLGLSDTPTTDLELKAVCDFTGLSEEFINFLKEPYLEGLNFPKIINSQFFCSFLLDFTQEYLKYSHMLEEFLKHQLEELRFTKESPIENLYSKERFGQNSRWIDFYNQKDLHLYRIIKSAENLLLELNKDTQEQIDNVSEEIVQTSEERDPGGDIMIAYFKSVNNSSKEGE